jgi:hypothetical protein
MDNKGIGMTGQSIVGWMDRQLPRDEEIFLDHVAHFVGDRDAAARALMSAGFNATPFSVQVTPDPVAPRPTGTGNTTAMLARGYIEVLFKTADTPLGQEFDNARARYCGLHLAAFAVADAEREHGRLAQSGFRMQPLVRMQRPVDTADGPGIASFAIARLAPGEMAEGRIQSLTHLTEHTVWQTRWMSHRNGATGLFCLVIAVDDVAEAAARFVRFTGRPATTRPFGRSLTLDRGRIDLMAAPAFAELFPDLAVPCLPFMAAYGVTVASLAALEAVLSEAGIASRRLGAAVVARFPDALGQGAWIFVEPGVAPPWH